MKQKEENRWINIHDDGVVIEMGLNRYSALTSRDESVWSRTVQERKKLNKHKGIDHGGTGHFHSKPNVSRFRSKLIIQLRSNKVFPKSTISTTCWEHDIPYILSKYQDKKGSCVKSYSWNGYTYSL